ncbi:MAG: pyruvate carboxyltransferase, partial [Acidobacteria bacterium]|nr:pyruvate carboxyltransferase [Acidobacteriota bacterium]
MSQPWKTDKWFTSPWNFLPEVREQFNFPETIKIHDVTLRDGEQQTGIMFNRAEKVAIAKKLAEAGVHRIEAGMPAVSAEDEAAIKDIVALGLSSEIFSFARCMPADVALAKACGV